MPVYPIYFVVNVIGTADEISASLALLVTIVSEGHTLQFSVMNIVAGKRKIQDAIIMHKKTTRIYIAESIVILFL